MTSLDKSKKIRQELQDGLNRTGIFVFKKRALFPTTGDRIVEQLQLAQGINRLLSQLSTEQEAQEEKEEGQKEQTKQTSESLQDATKQLKDEFKKLLTDLRDLDDLFVNFAHFELVVTKAQTNIEEELTKIQSKATSSDVAEIKRIITIIKTKLDAISGDIKIEKRMERRENVVLLRRCLTIEREVEKFIPIFFQHVQALHTFIETLERNSPQRGKLFEIGELLSNIEQQYRQLAGNQTAFKGHFERVGTLERERQPLEASILTEINTMKLEVERFSVGEFSGRVGACVNHLKPRILSIEPGASSLANCDQGIIGAMRDSKDDVTKMVEVLNDIEKPLIHLERLLNPSFWERVGNNVLHRTGNLNP